MISDSLSTHANDVFPALLAGLEQEFGGGGCEALARQFIDAEQADFYWESRGAERHLGTYEAFEDDEIELDRVAIIGCLDRRWCVAIMVVDGDGGVDRMLHLARFESAIDAYGAYLGTR